jgi:hypothetical protein
VHQAYALAVRVGRPYDECQVHVVPRQFVERVLGQPEVDPHARMLTAQPRQGGRHETPQGGTGSAVRTLVRLAEDAAAGLGMTSPAA